MMGAGKGDGMRGGDDETRRASWASRTNELWSKTICVEGVFEIDVPAGATYEHTPAEHTVEIALGIAPNSPVFIGYYKIPTGRRPRAGRFLLQRMRYFVEKCIPKRTDSKGAAVGEHWFDRDINSDLAQAVVFEEPNTWWLVRLCYPREGRSYFLLHSVGPAEYIKEWALPVIVSFRPL